MKKMSKKKMMTGGMANANAKVVAQAIPGSKGVTPKMNPNAVVTPAKMYGGQAKGKMMMKKGGKRMK